LETPISQIGYLQFQFCSPSNRTFPIFLLEAFGLKPKKLSRKIFVVLGLFTLCLGIVLIAGVVYASIQVKPLGLFYSVNNLYTADFSPTTATVSINQSQLFTVTLKSWSGAALDTSAHTIDYTWYMDQTFVPLSSSSVALWSGAPGTYQVKVEITIDGNTIYCYATINVTNPDGSMPVPTPNPTATPTPNLLTSLIPNNPLAKALIAVVGGANTVLGSAALLVSKRV
jgi:hypothetical protein